MAGPYFYDRVLQHTETTGTGTLTLGAAVPNYSTFSSTVGIGNSCYIMIEDTTNNAWELCLSEVGAFINTTLTRGTLMASSTGARVDFQAGTKRVYLVYPAHEIVARGGKPNGQILYGGVSASERLDLYSTSHATKGRIGLRDNTEFYGKCVFNQTFPTQITSNQNNYSILNASILYLTSDANGRKITGFDGGDYGQTLKVFNGGDYFIILSHEDSNSDSDNRINISYGYSLTLAPGEFADLFYDSEKWRCTPNTPIPGTMTMDSSIGTGNAPAGYIKPLGQAISRTNYPALFSRLGITWGSGDGSTTFNLPNPQGRTPIGSGTGSSLTTRTMGQTGGAETHTLSTSEIPAHAHSQASSEASYTYTGTGTDSHNWTVSGGGNAQAKLGFSTANAGGGGSHNNMQPYFVVDWLLRI